MGNTESNERQLFIGVILQLLGKRGIKVKKSAIQSFLSFVQEHCPWFPDEGSVNLDVWEKVGKQLKTYHAEHGSEKVPNDAFSLWNIIRDVLDPAPDSEKVHLKSDSEENAVAKPAPESKRVTFKEENEVKTVVKPEENEKNEDPPDYRQLRKMLAAVTTQEQPKDRDEEQDQPSPKQKENLGEITAKYHSDGDRHLLNKDAPKGLRETSPVRPSAPRSLRETSPIRQFVRFSHQTVKGSPEQEKRNTGRSHPSMPPPLCGGKGPPLGVSPRRVCSSPKDKFDPHLEASFLVPSAV